MNTDESLVHEALEPLVPIRHADAGDWSAVLRRVIEEDGADRRTDRARKGDRLARVWWWLTATRRRRLASAIAAVLIALTAPLIAVGATQHWWLTRTGETVPQTVFVPIAGRPAGWARSGNYWFVVYVKGGHHGPQGPCGFQGGTWRLALVETTRLPMRVVADTRISGAMCGNQLSWVRAGRFSDGHHKEAAFMLWTTPSLGATTYIYRTDSGRLKRLAAFQGDTIKLGAGTVRVRHENRQRSAHGEIEDTYRFADGRYRIVSSR